MRRGGGGRTCVEETLMEGLIQFKYMRRSGWTRVGGNKGTRPLSIDREEEAEKNGRREGGGLERRGRVGRTFSIYISNQLYTKHLHLFQPLISPLQLLASNISSTSYPTS
jgi:hypothetical protein